MKFAPDRPGPIVDPERLERRPSDEALDAVHDFARRRFPALGGRPVNESRVCQYESTPDSHFIIDRHPAWEDAWVVGGGSGHGFKHGPAMAELMAAALAGAPLPQTLPAEAAATAVTVLEALLRVQDFDTFALVLPLYELTDVDPRERREALAQVYLRRGFIDSAASEWIAIAQERPDARAYVGLAQIAWARGLAEDALAFAEEALALEPGHTEAALVRSNLLARAA